jgi:hypothetical protein
MKQENKLYNVYITNADNSRITKYDQLLIDPKDKDHQQDAIKDYAWAIFEDGHRPNKILIAEADSLKIVASGDALNADIKKIKEKEIDGVTFAIFEVNFTRGFFKGEKEYRTG